MEQIDGMSGADSSTMSFELERFGVVPGNRLELVGRWYGAVFVLILLSR